jgi:hypothetical protein
MMEGPSLTAGLEILEMPSGSGETGLKEGGRWRLALLTGGPLQQGGDGWTGQVFPQSACATQNNRMLFCPGRCDPLAV